MNRVELEKVGARRRATLDLVHVHELEILTTPTGTQSEAPHPTEAVDAHAHRRTHAAASTLGPAISVAR